MIFSGHYHRHQVDKNIIYVGTPLDLSFGESDVKHGFVVLDYSLQDWEFIETKDKLFHTIIYDDEKYDMEKEIKKIDITDNFVKIIKLNSSDSDKYDEFIKTLENSTPILLKKTNLDVEISNILDKIDIEDTENIMLIIKKYIDNLVVEDTKIKKENLIQLMSRLYDNSIVESKEIE